MDEKYIPYSVDGRSYKIPESKSAEFEKTYPEATIRMSAEDRVYNIPFSKKNEFMSTYPEATYAFKMEEPKEDAHDVTLGETIKYSVGNIGTTLAKGIWDWAVQDMSRGVYKDETGKVERNKDYDSMIRDNDYPIQISKKLGAKSEEFSRKADPTGGEKDYIDLISEGKVGTLLQKSLGDAIQSLPATVAAESPVLIVPYVLMNAASNYADQSINNPEIPKWKRGTYALASAVFEQAVERFENPFKGKAAKELTEDAAKKILNEGVSGGFKKVANRIVDVLKRIGKGAKGEAIEEGVTSFGNDAIGQALDWIDGNSDYGFTAQWEALKKENPDANMMDFALGKTREYINAAVGGGLSGVHMSGPLQIVHEIGSARSENRGRKVVDAARAMGETWGYADIYNANEEVANATAKAAQVFVDESGNPTLGEDFISSLSSEEAFNLSQKAEITDIQSAALLGLSIAKAQQEGMVDNINNGVNKYVSKQREIINSATENDNVVIGLYNNTPVYVMGGVVNNGSVTLTNGEAGPVVVVDMNTGEKTAARSEDISSAMSENALDFGNQKIGKFLDDEKRLREEAKNTVSPAAKLRAVQQYSGKKILLNGENGTYEVLVQQVLPEGKVIVKGKKGDLGGQSIVTMDAAAFYDSIYRDGEGKPVITNAPAEKTVEETEEVDEETPEAVVTGEEDYREQVVPIVINGKVVNVEVTGQDNTADRITYEYTDENGNVKSGSSTIGAFKTAAEQATTQQPDTETEVEPTINETVEEAPIDEAPVEEVTSEEIDWDALFEQDPYLYLKELQKQYGDGAVDVIDMEINATRSELESLEKNVGKTKNERMENLKRVSKLRTELGILEELKRSAAKSKATTTPETPTDTTPEVVAEPVTETPTEEAPVEKTPAEEAPVAETPVEEVQPEPAPVVEPVAEEVKPEPVAVAPMPIDNPIAEAKKREEQLLTLLGNAGVSNELKKDAARRAGKEVADMFATREEYEQYEAEAADLGEFVDSFDEGVNDSFANRNQQTNTGESQGISVPLESEPKEEENGTETETAEGEDTIRQGDDTVGGRTVDGGTETADTGNQGTEQELGESESESGEQVKKEYPARKGNATRQTLVDTFGFAKVSIPNTESKVLNTVYDFMMAMSKMLGVSPNVIGNGGWLDVANLRSNANASASYNWKNRSDGTVVEPRLKLKYGRVSSIAHEWWHSLDNVLKFFNTGKGRQTATYNIGALEAFGVRKEVKEALEAVLKSMKDSGFEARISAMSLPLQYKFYLLENEEMTARAFDAYINDKFEAAGIEIENAVYEKTPYQPTPEEMAVIAPAFDNLFKVLKEKEGLRKGTSVLYQIGNILEKGSEAWKAATDVAIKLLEDAGLAPIRVTDQQVEEMLKSKAKVDWLKTDNGTVYGWTDGKNIYLTEAGMNPNTPIHEYTHLWAKAMMQKNPKGWDSVKTLLKDTPVWNEVMKDSNYSNIHNNEDAVASEVLSRISGSENALKLEQMAQQMIDDAKGTMRKLEAQGIIQRIKDALNEFWNWVGTELFKIEKFDSVEQITDRVLWDLINKTNLGNLSEGQIEIQKENPQSVPQDSSTSPSPKVESNQTAERAQTKDAAKIQKSIDSLRELAELSKTANVVNPSTIVNYLADALHIIVKKNETSDTSKRNKYVLPNGETLSVRLSKHNTSAGTYIEFNFNQKYNLAITVKSIREPNTFVADDEVRLDEYVYFIEDIKKYSGSVLSEIASSLANFLESGVYVDTTGIAKINTSPEGVSPRTTENYSAESDELVESTKESVVLDPETASRETAKEVYDRVVKKSWQEFQRQFQDAYQPVRIALEAIQQETGNIPIEDYENYLLIQNQSSSRSRVETDNFVRKYYTPIIKHLEKLIDEIAKRDGMDAKDKETRAVIYNDIVKYLIAKHGLERNQYYQEHKTRKLTASEQNKEIKAAKDAYDTEVANITADSSFTDAERELKLREAFDAYEAAVTEIKTRQVPDLRDYSGLTSLFGLDSKKWEEAQNEAQTFVDEFENALGRENNEEGVMIKQSEIIEALWNKINAATNKTLRHSYESGMLSRTQYDDIKGMFKFYIPLRGFDETTAEDVYSYSRFEGNRFNPAVKTAKGRTSVADDPIAIIMNMAESEIAQGNKNRAKQALYNYLLNRAGANGVQNSLMQIQNVWYLKSVDESGDEVLQVAAPDYKGGETYDEFENRMMALAEEGKAVKGKKGSVDVGFRFQKQYNRDAHYVYLKVNGVDKAIYINGDPKAADAINGVYGKELGEAEKKVRDAQRVISSLFTNYSLEFTARNYSRDMIYSHINIAIKEPDPAYRKKFRQNWRTNNLGTMLKMLKAYRAGEYETRALTEAEASFVEFMNNGGQTGYTIINSVENHKRDLEREILGLQNGLAHGGVKNTKVVGTALKGIELLNEASELVTRFAAFKTSRDMGRSINRAISDAKEITVNFNTKGAQDGKGFWGMTAQYFGWSKYFFNASVQGVQNIKAMADANRLKFCTTVGGVAAFGFMTPIIMSLLAEMFGGDEEEYWNIPEYDRQNNFCFPIPFTKGAYAKVPLPIGFREIYAMGDMVAAMMFDKKFSRDFGQVGMDMANKIASIVLPINPLESTANGLSIWASLSNIALPSGMQFITQNMSNIDWKGAPLQKEYTYNENDPQWMKAFANNPKWMTVLSKWCNENIDINGDYKGLDWSPEKLDNTLSNLGGGIYTLIKKIGRFFSMAWNEENRNLYNVPLAGVVLGSGADIDDKFVTGAFFEMQDYYDERAGYIKRRAEMFGLTLDDVFLKEKGKHHPKMLEIYTNSNFDFMQEWYKGNKELKELDKEIKKLKKDIEAKENPSTAILNKLARKEAQFAAERREFVNDMLELD